MARSAVVVGAGVAGLATAVGLRRGGWDVTVLERWPRVVGTGAALGLWPDAQEALERLGLGDQLSATAVPYRAGAVRTPAGRRLVDLPLTRIQRRTGRTVVLLSRTSLIAMLAGALDGVEVRTGVAVDDPRGLAAAADVVVGADGLRSAVREAFFPGAAAPRDAGFTAWRGSVDAEVADHGETWGAGLLFGVTPMAPGRTNWYAAVAGRTGRTEPERALRALQDRYAGWPSPVPQLLAATDPATVLRHQVHDLAPALPSYVRGGAVLVGDAAHAMTPMLGQGACQALVDGVVLAECLAGAGSGPGGTAAALLDYDRRRRRPTQRIAAASRVGATVALAGRCTWLRDAALRLAAPLAR